MIQESDTSAATSRVPFKVQIGRPLKDAWLPSPETERRRAVEAAKREGVEEGFRAGLASAQEEINLLRTETARLRDETLRTLCAREAALVREAETILPSLALEVARRVVAGVEFDQESVRKRVEEILAEAAPRGESVEIQLSPDDCKLLGEISPELREDYPGLKIESNPSLTNGDCVLKGRFGIADGRLKTKWQVVADLLAH